MLQYQGRTVFVVPRTAGVRYCETAIAWRWRQRTTQTVWPRWSDDMGHLDPTAYPLSHSANITFARIIEWHVFLIHSVVSVLYTDC